MMQILRKVPHVRLALAEIFDNKSAYVVAKLLVALRRQIGSNGLPTPFSYMPLTPSHTHSVYLLGDWGKNNSLVSMYLSQWGMPHVHSKLTSDVRGSLPRCRVVVPTCVCKYFLPNQSVLCGTRSLLCPV